MSATERYFWTINTVWIYHTLSMNSQHTIKHLGKDTSRKFKIWLKKHFSYPCDNLLYRYFYLHGIKTKLNKG